MEGAVLPADYPGHFVRGLPIGDALPCKDNWEFYCSGGWYGSYEVRRSYDGPGLEREWETRGSSFSRLGAYAHHRHGIRGGMPCAPLSHPQQIRG